MLSVENINFVATITTLGFIAAAFILSRNDPWSKLENIAETTSENPDTTKINDYMLKDLQNKMITWKKQNPDRSSIYKEFIKDTFPENCNLDSNNMVESLDQRVTSKTWLNCFEKTTPHDKLHILGNPPYTR